MRKLIGFPAVFMSVVAVGGLIAGTARAADMDLTNFRVVFDEQFRSTGGITDGYTLEPGKVWIDHTPTGDFGDAYWRFSSLSAGSNGLRITAKKDPVTGFWEAGGLSSCDGSGNGFAQQYGYFEASMKVPGGMGTWPAFWMIQKFGGPSSPPNPKTEVDVMVGHRTIIQTGIYGKKHLVPSVAAGSIIVQA